MQQTTKKELRQVKELVREELKYNPRARHSDDELFARVAGRMAEQAGVHLWQMHFYDVFCRSHPWLPRYASVVRLRRMVQRENPELLPKIKVRRGRKKQEADFVEYARRNGEV